MPCRMRKAIRAFADQAKPHSADVTVNAAKHHR
jgi:hypothetical protein